MVWAGMVLAGGVAAQSGSPEAIAQARAQQAGIRAELAAARAELAAVGALQALDASWAVLGQDPEDDLYRQARRALARQQYQEAARLFMELRQRYSRSAYTGDAYYFEALARYREGSSSNLTRARELLSEQAELFAEAATRADARTLEARIMGAAARRGDATATAQVRERAAQSCEGEDMAVRSAALSALLSMDSERAVPILREVLQARDACSSELRRQAVFLLAQHMTPETVDVLVDLGHRNPDPDPEVREVAVFWLSQVDDPAALDALMEILSSGQASGEIQERALFAIAQSDSPEARSVLESFARRADTPPYLRENAIFWLGQSEGSLTFMREIYGSLDDPELKERVLFGIGQSDDPEARAWLLERALDASEPMEVRRSALFWAGQSGLAPAQVVRIYRTAEDRELREHAILVLSQAGEEDQTAAVDAMMEIARTETDPELKERVVFWLGQSDDPRVPEFLLELIRGGG
jgi:HEAT repeat protein